VQRFGRAWRRCDSCDLLAPDPLPYHDQTRSPGPGPQANTLAVRNPLSPLASDNLAAAAIKDIDMRQLFSNKERALARVRLDLFTILCCLRCPASVHFQVPAVRRSVT
jgi:hypothetical protein